MRALRVLQVCLWASALASVGAFAIYRVNQPLVVEQTSAGSGIGGAFRLTSHKGETLTEADVRGKPHLVFFGFTSCPEVCPTTLFELSNLLQELGTDGDKLKALFVTVDPERDTQEVLASYMSAFDARILGLTGTQAEVEATAKAYKASLRKVPIEGGGYTMDHTAIVYLMDKDGRFVSSLDFHEAKETQLAKLRRLVRN